jgi:NAD(P)H-dependent FMN reductase
LRVLVIDGHPRNGSFGSALAGIIHRAAASRTKECRLMRLRDLHFDPYAHGRTLNPALCEAQHGIVWAEVIVIVYPTWWGTTPALLKGFLDVCAAVLPLCMAGPAQAWLWWTALPAIPHAVWLALRLRRFTASGSPPGRIDALLIFALTFMIWFCLVPLIEMLMHAR